MRRRGRARAGTLFEMHTERADTMTLRTYVPRPPLSEFVACLWLSERSGQPAVRERALPHGTIQFLFNLRDDRPHGGGRPPTDRAQRFDGAIVCGPHSQSFVMDAAPDEVLLGVHFKPGGALPFLPMSAGELHNADAPLDALWGARAAGLREQLVAAATPTERIRRLEHLLLAYAPRPLATQPAVAFALRAFGRVPRTQSIAAVAEHVGLSHRRFIQVFRDAVGLTPSQFCRVCRFQAVVRVVERMVERGRPVAWTDVALRCGYYDQAHCSNEFQALAGLTPTAYLRDRGEWPNHVPLAE